ncbi:MAG: glycosyltransferase [Muribaculaceae bacterium]|nr:glycosyltransferase [Muribaculaceae bacterium]
MSAFRLFSYEGNLYKRAGGTLHFYRYAPLGQLNLCCTVIEGVPEKETFNIGDMKLFPLKHIKNAKNLLKFSRSNYKMVKEAVEKSDAVIGYVPSSAAYAAFNFAKKQGKPYLAMAIGCPWDVLTHHGWKGKLIAPIQTLKMKKMMKKTDFSIYVTQKFLQKRYPSKGLSAGISNVILHDVNSNILSQRLEKITSTTINSSNEIKLATCAAINVKYKGQEDVIKALSKLQYKYNIHYYLAGNGDASYLMLMAKKYNMTNRVHFLGGLKQEDVYNLFKNIDIYIHPSKTEGLPRSVVEAMSMAVPCLGANAGGTPELLPKECVFKKGNISDIIKKINWILDTRVLSDLAIVNFEKSKDFLFEKLEKERNEFIQTWVNSFNCN